MSYDEKEDSTVFGYRCQLTQEEANAAHEWCLYHPLVAQRRVAQSVVDWLEQQLSPRDMNPETRLAAASKALAEIELKQFRAGKAWVQALGIPEGM